VKVFYPFIVCFNDGVQAAMKLRLVIWSMVDETLYTVLFLKVRKIDYQITSKRSYEKASTCHVWTMLVYILPHGSEALIGSINFLQVLYMMSNSKTQVVADIWNYVGTVLLVYCQSLILLCKAICCSKQESACFAESGTVE